MQQGQTQLGKAHIAPACNHMICHGHNGLLLMFIAHLGPAQHHLDVWVLRFHQAHHLCGGVHIPDVHTQAHDLGLQQDQLIHHGLRWLLNRKFSQDRVCSKEPTSMAFHVGQQIPQT